MNRYPYTDMHEMNLDWIISKIKNVEDAEKATEQFMNQSKDYAEASEASAETAQYWATLPKLPVTPEMFGAKGDGVTDDTDAVNAASAFGCMVGQKGSRYLVGRINVQNDVSGVHFIIKNEDSVIVENDNITIKDCIFENDEIHDSSTRGEWMVSCERVKCILIQNCEFTKAVDALYVKYCSNVKITGCSFHDIPQVNTNGYGVLLIECDGVWISRNSFVNVARHGVYVSIDDTPSKRNRNVFISENRFEWTGAVSGNTSGYEEAINVRPAVNIYVHDNVFINQFGMCNFVAQSTGENGGAVVGTENAVIRNNECVNCRNTVRTDDGQINSLRSDESVPSVTNIIISGNRLIGNGSSTFCKFDTSGGYVIVTDNLIRYASQTNRHALYCITSSGELIQGKLFLLRNILYNVGCLLNSYAQSGAITDLTISDNDFKGESLYNIRSEIEIGSLKVTGNDCTSNRSYDSASVVTDLTVFGNKASTLTPFTFVPTRILAWDDNMFATTVYDATAFTSVMKSMPFSVNGTDLHVMVGSAIKTITTS